MELSGLGFNSEEDLNNHIISIIDNIDDHTDCDDDLESWDISQNRLTVIPSLLLSNYGQFIRLLDISSNQLSINSILPLTICTNLTYLYLYCNNLEGIIPNDFITSFLDLKYLSLHTNKITAIPKEISLLTRLEYLHVGNNCMNEFPIVILQNCTLLDTLNIGGNKFLVPIPANFTDKIKFFKGGEVLEGVGDD